MIRRAVLNLPLPPQPQAHGDQVEEEKEHGGHGPGPQGHPARHPVGVLEVDRDADEGVEGEDRENGEGDEPGQALEEEPLPRPGPLPAPDGFLAWSGIRRFQAGKISRPSAMRPRY